MKFELDVLNSDRDSEYFEEEISKFVFNKNASEMNSISDNTGIQFFQNSSNNLFVYESKWYEYVEDMKEFSTKYPETIFRLMTDGEGYFEVMVHFFKNGKHYSVYLDPSSVPFNESKLE